MKGLMFALIRDGTLYAPEKIGKKDILIVGRTIARISDRIDLPESSDVQTVSASGKLVAPNMIDLRVHLLGGG
jgi:beta-aspartyl-dipeptidase (metallo-type)